MSDVENEMEVLQRKLATKTREIEALVAKEQGFSDLDAMESTDHARLQAMSRGSSTSGRRRTFVLRGPTLTRR